MSSCVVLTIGLEYSGNLKLSGTINDSVMIERMFTVGNNRVMYLRSKPGSKIDTALMKRTIQAWLEYEPTWPHVFHYAGHGGQSKVLTASAREFKEYIDPAVETDNLDEGLYDEYGKFFRDSDFANLFDDFHGPMMFVMDQCHSDNFVEVCDRKKVLVIASVPDNRLSYETYGTNAFGENKIHGMLSFNLCASVKSTCPEGGEVDMYAVAKTYHDCLGIVRVSKTLDSFKVLVSNWTPTFAASRFYRPTKRDLSEQDEESVGVLEPKTKAGCWCTSTS